MLLFYFTCRSERSIKFWRSDDTWWTKPSIQWTKFICPLFSIIDVLIYLLVFYIKYDKKIHSYFYKHAMAQHAYENLFPLKNAFNTNYIVCIMFCKDEFKWMYSSYAENNTFSMVENLLFFYHTCMYYMHVI